jgi:hypothetical protein
VCHARLQVYTPSLDLDKVDAILRTKFTLRRAKIGGDGTTAYDGEARSRAAPRMPPTQLARRAASCAVPVRMLLIDSLAPLLPV